MYQRIEEVNSEDSVGKKVKVRGWIYRKRRSGKIVFIIVRDSTGIVQCIVEKNSVSNDEFKSAVKAGIESSVIVEGIVEKDERSPTGYEIKTTSFNVVSYAEPFPITEYQSDELLMNLRHLWLRSRKMTAIMKIRDTVFKGFHEFLRGEGFYEVHCPMFVSTAVEGGSTLFEVPYFGRKVYLTQSSQFYLETMIFSLEKVYTVAPSFRAEKSRTRRHLTEYWHGEAEAAWFSNEDMMKLEERMIEHIVELVIRERKNELDILGRDVESLKNVQAPFERIRYDKIVDIATEIGIDMEYGEDLGADEEREITKRFNAPVFITHFPAEIKPFYHRPDPENPSVVLCHDMLAPEGYGEIIGGGERIYEIEVLRKRLADEGWKEEDYYWYVDLRKYGSVPHAGFGLGMDRAVMWIAGLDHIKYAIPYPRTIRRVTP